MKLPFRLLLCAAACASLLSCRQAADDGRVTIGVSLLTREHVFYNQIEAALTDEAQRRGVELIIKDANQDSSLQISQVQDFLTLGVDAIILSPTASAGIAPAIDMAAEQGIPVVTMDIQAEGTNTPHVGTDNYLGGKMAGRYTAETVLGGRGKVAIITYSEVESCVNREKGFVEIMDAYPDIEVVDIQNCSGDQAKAASLTQDLLVKHPQLDVIFGVGDPFAMGAYATVQANGREIKIVGFDGLPEAVAEIQKGGLWVADVAQNADAIGRTAITLVLDRLEGKDTPVVTLIEPQIIERENL